MVRAKAMSKRRVAKRKLFKRVDGLTVRTCSTKDRMQSAKVQMGDRETAAREERV